MNYLMWLSVLFLATANLSAQSAAQWSAQGQSAYARQQWRQAEEAYRRALQQLPDAATAYNLANTLYQQERYGEALSYYQQSVRQGHQAAWHNLGNCHYQLGQYAASNEAYRQALLVQPDDYDTKYNLAQSQRALAAQQQAEDNANNQDDNGMESTDQADSAPTSSNQDNESEGSRQQDQPGESDQSSTTSDGQSSSQPTSDSNSQESSTPTPMDRTAALDLLKVIEREEARAQQRYKRSDNRSCDDKKAW